MAGDDELMIRLRAEMCRHHLVYGLQPERLWPEHSRPSRSPFQRRVSGALRRSRAQHDKRPDALEPSGQEFEPP